MRAGFITRLCASLLSAFSAATPIALGQVSNVQTSLAPSLELSHLIELVAHRLDLTIEYDPTALSGQITVQSPAGLGDAQLLPLLNRVLTSHGMTTIQPAGSPGLVVVKLSDAASLSRVQSGDQLSPLPGYQCILLQPQHRSPKQAADFLRPVLSKSGSSITELASGGLLVSDLTPKLEQAVVLLASYDRADSDTDFLELPLRHISAAQLIALADDLTRRNTSPAQPGADLMPSPDGASVFVSGSEDQRRYWRNLIQRLDRPETEDTREYSAGGGSPRALAESISALLGPATDASPARIRVNDDAGTIAVTATPSEHARIRLALDARRQNPPGADSLRTFEIRNRPVSEMVATLRGLLSLGALADAKPRGGGEPEPAAQRELRGMSAQSAAARRPTGAGGSPTQEPSPLRLTSDEATNSLIAVGDAEAIGRLAGLIQTLDVRQPQVMLEVMLVSLNDSQSLSLGVELERLGHIGDAAYRLSSLFGLSSPGGSGRTTGDSPGFTGAVLNPGEFSVIVKALEAVNKGRSLSAPRVLVVNNQQATFSSVLQQPILETARSNQATTTSFGGTQDAGTTISVKPQIAAGDHLILTYQVSLSSFVGASSGNGLPPPRQQNKIDSMATIPDGHTVVVGGLEVTTDSDAENRLPVLGTIPLVGNLFKNQTNSRTRSRFYVFIHASVLRSASFDDLNYLSQTPRSNAGVEDDLPALAPRVIK